MVRRNKWNGPASIELEYAIAGGADAVKEARKGGEYSRAALTARTLAVERLRSSGARIKKRRGVFLLISRKHGCARWRW